jgi:hypothetical protein
MYYKYVCNTCIRNTHIIHVLKIRNNVLQICNIVLKICSYVLKICTYNACIYVLDAPPALPTTGKYITVQRNVHILYSRPPPLFQDEGFGLFVNTTGIPCINPKPCGYIN